MRLFQRHDGGNHQVKAPDHQEYLEHSLRPEYVGGDDSDPVQTNGVRRGQRRQIRVGQKGSRPTTKAEARIVRGRLDQKADKHEKRPGEIEGYVAQIVCQANIGIATDQNHQAQDHGGSICQNQPENAAETAACRHTPIGGGGPFRHHGNPREEEHILQDRGAQALLAGLAVLTVWRIGLPALRARDLPFFHRILLCLTTRGPGHSPSPYRWADVSSTNRATNQDPFPVKARSSEPARPSTRPTSRHPLRMRSPRSLPSTSWN